MPAPTYNCPFSANDANGGGTDGVLVCAELLALNTNAGCALYDFANEQCMLREYLGRNNEVGGIPVVLPLATP